MRWIWQLPDWPDSRCDADRIRASEEQFLKGSGVVIGALHHLDTDARDGLTIELISQEVVDSSAVESEILDRASAQSSLARHLRFATDHGHHPILTSRQTPSLGRLRPRRVRRPS